jgi:tRNA(fMet)-specific endonuclease VapC
LNLQIEPEGLALILDTNALSAIADGDEAVEPAIRQAREIAMPVIVLGEYKYGIRRSRNRRLYEKWLAEFVAACRVLPVDENTAERYAEVRDELRRAGLPIPRNDLWIAALARQYALPLLSRDAHFDNVAGLNRVAW